jgi:hypothetical protein
MIMYTFSLLQQVARRLNLVKVKHTPSEEQFEEQLWIQKECRIRYVKSPIVLNFRSNGL